MKCVTRTQRVKTAMCNSFTGTLGGQHCINENWKILTTQVLSYIDFIKRNFDNQNNNTWNKCTTTLFWTSSSTHYTYMVVYIFIFYWMLQQMMTINELIKILNTHRKESSTCTVHTYPYQSLLITGDGIQDGTDKDCLVRLHLQVHVYPSAVTCVEFTLRNWNATPAAI